MQTATDVSQWDILISLDPCNRQCVYCKGNALELTDDCGNEICPSCMDDILEMKTGCRFGIVGCDPTHDDCESNVKAQTY